MNLEVDLDRNLEADFNMNLNWYGANLFCDILA